MINLLRVAAQLRRIAKALERMNELSEERHPREEMRAPRKATLSVPTRQQWSEAYDREHPR